MYSGDFKTFTEKTRISQFLLLIWFNTATEQQEEYFHCKQKRARWS